MNERSDEPDHIRGAPKKVVMERWLSEEEWADYNICLRIMRKDTYEHLAACRELMADAKQYIQDDLSGMPFDEDQVKQLEARGKEIYDKLAKQVDGFPRRVEKEEK